MIDLHLHLDGSLTAQEIWRLAQQQALTLPVSDAAFTRAITAPKNCESLNQYLKAFEVPLLVLQQEQAIFQAVKWLVIRLAAQGIWYAEIRFAPQLHCAAGLSQEQVVNAAVAGRNCGLADVKGKMNAQLILCMMRGAKNELQNRETLCVAKHWLGDGVCAVDLAGAEALYPTRTFAPLFAAARDMEIPFTIHAGEADGPQSVWDALSFGAKRVGHGVHSIEDLELVEKLREKGIVLELCPSSNVQTKAVASFAQHPIRWFLQQGVKATVNTDNMTVSGTDLFREFDVLKKETGLTACEAQQLLLNAADAAFLPTAEKEKLKAKYMQV